MLMVTTKEEERFKDKWYLDSGCLSHMVGRKDCFINISPLSKNKVKFETKNILSVKGIRDVMIKIKDGKELVISSVLYIPYMKINMLSISQLIKRSYKVLIEDRMVRVIGSRNRLI